MMNIFEISVLTNTNSRLSIVWRMLACSHTTHACRLLFTTPTTTITAL